MSWGDHDTDLINKKLNVEGRLKIEAEQKQKEKLSQVQELFFAHQFENNECIKAMNSGRLEARTKLE